MSRAVGPTDVGDRCALASLAKRAKSRGRRSDPPFGPCARELGADAVAVQAKGSRAIAVVRARLAEEKVGPREARDAAAQALSAKVVETGEILLGLFGGDSLARLGLEVTPPRDPALPVARRVGVSSRCRDRRGPLPRT